MTDRQATVRATKARIATRKFLEVFRDLLSPATLTAMANDLMTDWTQDEGIMDMVMDHLIREVGSVDAAYALVERQRA